MRPLSRPARPSRRPSLRARNRPDLERLEGRLMMDASSSDTGSVVTNLVENVAAGRASLVVTFSEPLAPASAEYLANYSVRNVNAPGSIPVVSARYDVTAQTVTLGLARPTPANRPVALTINGGLTGVTGLDGVLFDGDNDQQPGGNYIALLTEGRSINFVDSAADRANIRLTGPGEMQLVQLPNGDPTSLRIDGAVAGRTTLTGSLRPGPGSQGTISFPQLVGITNVRNNLPYPAFDEPAVANPGNVPFTIRLTPVAIPGALAVQSAVSVEAGGLGLVFGGRTNGLHNFNDNPIDPTTGQSSNFPPEFQNRTIQVIDPSTGRVTSIDWSQTGLPASETDPLSSTNQQFLQVGDTLYVIGGYGLDSTTNTMVTFDTLTAIDVPGMIHAVTTGASVAPFIRQTHDPRLRVTGGDLGAIGNRFYLVLGQDFEGDYNAPDAAFPNFGYTQIYTDTIGSFGIVDRPGLPLAISDYSAQVDPVNFRRRDGILHPIVTAGQLALESDGGVFTPGPNGTGYRNPIVIGPDGVGRVNSNYQQFFSQYDAPTIPLYSARTGSMQTIFLGGISLYHFDPATGTLSEDTGLPFVPDITDQVASANGQIREYSLLPQLPGLLGAEASFFPNPTLPTYANGVIQLDKLAGPTVLGYMYGGIQAQQPNFGSSGAVADVFLVTLVPNGR